MDRIMAFDRIIYSLQYVLDYHAYYAANLKNLLEDNLEFFSEHELRCLIRTLNESEIMFNTSLWINFYHQLEEQLVKLPKDFESSTYNFMNDQLIYKICLNDYLYVPHFTDSNILQIESIDDLTLAAEMISIIEQAELCSSCFGNGFVVCQNDYIHLKEQLQEKVNNLDSNNSLTYRYTNS